MRRHWRVKLEASIALLQTSLFVLFETWIAIHKFKTDSFYVLHGFKNILFVLTFFNFGQSSLQVFSVSPPCFLVVIDEIFSSNLSINFTLSLTCYTLLLHFLWVYLCIPGPQLNMLFFTICSGLWIGLSWSPPPPSSCPQYKAGSSFMYFVTNNW